MRVTIVGAATLAATAMAQETVPLVVTNNCNDPVWPGIIGHTTGPSPSSGFKLDPKESKNMTIGADWTGRLWGRTNCTFNENGTASANGNGPACLTGDCDTGKLECVNGVCSSSSRSSAHGIECCSTGDANLWGIGASCDAVGMHLTGWG